jgi:LacI family transcriptional regulator
MKITAKTIAEQLNISTSTVDRVLNNRGRVSPKTVKKVLDMAKELNYRPNKSASFLAKKKDIRVAFVFPEYPEYFYREIELGIRNTLEDIQDYGFNADIIKTPHSIEKQIKVVQSVINSDSYDGLVFCPVDAFPLTKVIDEGIDQDFPVYTFNNDSPSSKRLSFVGADYFDSGRLAGELLYKLTGSSKRLAIILDQMDTFQMKQKIKGFEEYMSICKEINFVKSLTIDHTNLTKSIEHLESNLKEVDGIYVACGALADVAKEMEFVKLNKKPILIGHDMSDDIYDFLQKEVVTASICQDPIYQGSLAVRIAFNHLMLENRIEKIENIVKLEIVTKGNAKYYLH